MGALGEMRHPRLDALQFRAGRHHRLAKHAAGLDPRNLCNRGRLGRGVQIELSDRLRGGRYEKAVIDAVRAALHGRVMTRR